MIGNELIDYLVSEGVGVKGTDILLGSQPETPDDCITIYDETAPVIPESSSLTVDQFGIQVLVRNTNYLTTIAKIMAIHKLLIGFGGEPFIAGGSTVHASYVITAPGSIGKDPKSRNEWSSHYVFRVESTGDKYRL